jgi:hypothetical protein
VLPWNGQQHERAVAHDVMRGRERRERRVVGRREADPPVADAGQVDVPSEEAVQLGPRLLHRPPLVLGDDELGPRQGADAADVVLVEMGEDGDSHVPSVVSNGRELRGQRLVRRDPEAGKAAVQEPGHTPGKVAGIGDRGAILPRVEQERPSAWSTM